MDADNILQGDFNFLYLGRSKAPFTVSLAGEKSLEKVLSQYLLSSDIDWTYSIDTNCGEVFVGMFRKVGEFRRVTNDQA